MKFEDLGMRVSVPFNQDPRLVGKILKFKEHLHDVYLPCRPDIMGSGRWWKGDVDEYDELVENVVAKLKDNDIGVNMLFNAICPELGSTKKVLEYLDEIVPLGIDTVTVCSLLLAKRIRHEFPDLKISASTNAFVNSVRKAMFWKGVCRVDDICVDRDINLRPKLIGEIRRASGATIRMLVNEGCLPDCPFRVQCMTFMSHSGKGMSRDPFIHECFAIRGKQLWQEYGSTSVVPGALKHYKGIVDFVKLQGRSYETKTIIRMLEHYINNTDSFHTDPEKTFYKPEEVFLKVSNCDRDCDVCGWCRDYLEKQS